MTPREPLTAGSDEVLLHELLAGARLKDAAEEARMSYATAKRRWADDEFRGQFEEARAEPRESTVRRLDSAVARAIARLDYLAENAARESDQIAAARALAQHAPNLMSAAEVRQRLEELERREGLDPRTGRLEAA